MSKVLSQDDSENDTDDTEGYVETVVRTEKRKVLLPLFKVNFQVRGASRKDKTSAMQVFNVEQADEAIQVAPSTETVSTQTSTTIESTLANLLRTSDDDDTLRTKIDALALGLGSQRSLIDELLRKSKSTESSVLSESAVIRRQGPPPPYEPPTSRWPKFLTVAPDGEVSRTGWMTFMLWSVVLFLLGLTSQNIFVPRRELGGLFHETGYASAFEMFGQRHWWEKWGMDSPVGQVVWRVGWWWDELLRGDAGWPS